MIKVLDYGMGNTASMLNMIRKAGGQAELCALPSELDSVSAIILPGVGSFDNGMTKLENSGLLEALRCKVIEEKVPFLGVCLGVQLLFEKSEEGKLPGLGWIQGDVKRFDFSDISSNKSLKVPHMGWNIVNPKTYENLFSGLEDEARFYFVHSYHVNCANSSDILATANYGYEFTCSVRHDNIWGAQFHPEKSHRFGVQFFKNFLKEIGHA
ncbi:MAG: imidazole glycerol phosphate synthase subunit HisH [Hydrogenovibrio sp.]|uniref:imidazole glycerol phosphate synthase subunit HisH n=1 Tax=Hydrogenovibrio sp. TaxID=2065821 RepID=UPI00286FAFE8|nr:imidazole glycerol phosphate synthase subunit HisH [Hydrogenovibrio sp.]MDR9498527.1 imidazole glycerol phosphate synthase subunit HisH [Hydrogenovibrio sp.]MDR9499243.1 imidazole glycerol phosphate synthase subunit HisH [Hydrogenovibrio sp.]